MILSINDRWALLQILPKEGNVIDGKQRRRLRRKLELTDGDLVAIEHKFITCSTCGTNSRENWNAKKCDTVTKDVSINKWETDTILMKFREMNSSNKLPDAFIPTFAKFDPSVWKEDDDAEDVKQEDETAQ